MTRRFGPIGQRANSRYAHPDNAHVTLLTNELGPEGKPIGVELPRTLELKVERTEPGVRGDTRTSVTKPAVLENGVTVQVPAFVGEGEVIRVDPEAGSYIERVR